MIITISGKPGSGKTCAGELLSRKLKMRFISVGNLRRRWAEEKGMKIEDFNKMGEHESWTDKKADKYQERLGKSGENLIIEGRTGFYFIPKSIKVFFDVDMDVAAGRIQNDPRSSEKHQKTTKGVKNQLLERIESDKIRYKKYYDIDIFDMKYYDLVIDTTELSVEETAQRIIDYIDQRFGKKDKPA